MSEQNTQPIEEEMPDILYHYCSNEAFTNIIKTGTLRMSDITKSNDAKELRMFFPTIFDGFYEVYKENPVDLEYKDLKNVEAMRALVDDKRNAWDELIEEGRYVNYVACFTEEKDNSSHWVLYGDDAAGCSIGMSFKKLLEYGENKSILLKKVKYVKKEELQEEIKLIAGLLYEELKRMWRTADYLNRRNSSSQTIENVKVAAFTQIIKLAFQDSLRYKLYNFKDEQEWRLFFLNVPVDYKDKEINYVGREIENNESLAPVKNIINEEKECFTKNGEEVEYVPLIFDHCFVREVWLGSKNETSLHEIAKFMEDNNYSAMVCKENQEDEYRNEGVKVIKSEMKYR